MAHHAGADASRGKWPVLAAMARERWMVVLKFLLIMFVAQLPADLAVLYVLLHH